MLLQTLTFTLCALLTTFVVSRLLMNYCYQERDDLKFDKINRIKMTLNLSDNPVINQVILEMNYE